MAIFSDPHCLDKFSAVLMGVGIAGASLATGLAPPPGVLEGAIASTGLWALLRDKRTSAEADALKTLSRELETHWQAWGAHSSHADEGMRAHVLASFESVVDKIHITGAEVVATHLSAHAVADLMVEKAADALPTLFDSKGPHDTERELPCKFLHGVTLNAYQRLLQNRDYFDRLRPGLWQLLLDAQQRIESKIDAQTRLIETLQTQLTTMQAALDARAAGVSERALLRLVRPIAEHVEDSGEALLALKEAVDIAVRVQAEGHHGTNLGDFVDDVLSRVTALSAEGDYTTAISQLDDALKQEEAESKARILRLLGAAIDQHRLAFDADGAASKIARRVSLETPDPDAHFAALRMERAVWYQRGRDKGLRLDLEIAIALARITYDKAQTANERGAALNDLGVALQTLGAREAGTDRLEQAITAYTEALKERTRDRVPLQWAMTQMNLGNALQTLGAREAGTDRLEEAVTAYTEALKERTRDRVPLEWAMTQMNLGAALRTLGEREAGTDRLEQAVTAYTEALKEYTRDRVPLEWAMTQMNVGNALAALGEREAGTDRLEHAVTAYTEALKENTRDRVPLEWAKTQNNLGGVLRTLGEREAGTDRLEQAVTAYTEALKEYTRDRVPLQWARTQMNLGNALATLGEREAGTDRLEHAVTAYTEALKENTRDRVPLQWATTQGNICNVHRAFFDKTGDAARLDKAQSALDAARDVFEEAGASRYLAWCDNLQTKINARRA